MRPTIKDTCDCCNGTTTILLTTYEARDVIVKCELCDGTGWVDREMSDTEAIDFLLARQNFPDKARVIHRYDSGWRVCKVDGSAGRHFDTMYEAEQYVLDVNNGRAS